MTSQQFESREKMVLQGVDVNQDAGFISEVFENTAHDLIAERIEHEYHRGLIGEMVSSGITALNVGGNTQRSKVSPSLIAKACGEIKPRESSESGFMSKNQSSPFATAEVDKMPARKRIQSLFKETFVYCLITGKLFISVDKPLPPEGRDTRRSDSPSSIKFIRLRKKFLPDALKSTWTVKDSLKVGHAKYYAWLPLLCLWLFLPTAALATCPTGPIQNLGVTLAQIGVTNCLYIANNGLDSNTGTKASPWLHDPTMQAATGNAAAHTVTAGDGFIFRGGDTWHFNSGSPLIGTSWSMTTSGTSSNQIYRGVDTTWFSGASWARPILSYDNPVASGVNQVASCNFPDSGTFLSNSGNWNFFDNFELTGYCWDGSASVTIAENFSGSNQTISNAYVHGWTEATSATGDDFRAMSGGASGVSNTRITYSVFDGSDSTFGTRYTVPSPGQCTSFPNMGVNCAVTTGTPTFAQAGATGWMITGSCYQVDHSIFRHTSNALECNGTIIHDNLFEYNFESGNSNPHGNLYEALTGSAASLSFYNNIARHNSIGVSWWVTGGPNVYFFNNVAEDDQHNGGAANGNCEMFSPNGSGSTPVLITVFLANNTVDPTCGIEAPSANPPWASGSSVTFENTHFIGSGTTIASRWTCGTGNTCGTPVDNGGEKFMTSATATSQGYVLSNDFAPTLGGGTIGFGNNMTSQCSTYSADSALCSGTSNSCAEASGSGGLVVSCPAIPVNARPSSGAWDAGAYEFSASSGPALSISPPSFNFGNQNVNTASSSQAFTLSNTGTSTATLSSISYTGTNASDFSTSSTTCGATLAVSTNCTINVTFTPAATGSRSGNLVVTDTPDSVSASASLSGTGVIPQVATPTFSPLAGTYNSPQTVTISTTTVGATICYTADGSPPTSNGAGVCTHGTTLANGGTVSVSVSETLKAIGSLSGDTDSAVGSAAYTLQVATPTFSPVAGTYNSPQSVSLSTITPSATICFTTDGTTPTANGAGTCINGTRYSTPIAVAVSETIKAVGSENGFTDSSVGSATYVITAINPPAAIGVLFGRLNSVSGQILSLQ